MGVGFCFLHVLSVFINLQYGIAAWRVALIWSNRISNTVGKRHLVVDDVRRHIDLPWDGRGQVVEHIQLVEGSKLP